MAKILLLGGTFDPIHYGHLHVLKNAIEKLHFDLGWFIVAHQAPLKDTQQLSFEKRCEYVNWMIQDETNLECCEIERTLPTPNYTINTILKLQQLYPQHEFSLLIGSDQAANFEKWKDYEKLLELITIYVYPRNNQTFNNHQLVLLPLTPLEVSSTLIRKGVNFSTHSKILEDIILNGYYAQERLFSYLKPKRAAHCLRVATLCAQLAKHYGFDVQLAYGAGIAHDLVKQESEVTLRRYLDEQELQFDVKVWHGFAAKRFYQQHFHVKNKDFLRAIYNHVLGQDGCWLSQILYIADKCEPNRKYPTQHILDLAYTDLNEGFELCKKEAYEYQLKKENR